MPPKANKAKEKAPRKEPLPSDPVDEALELHHPVQDIYQPPLYHYYSRFLPSAELPRFLDAVPEYLRPALLALTAYKAPPDTYGLPDRRAAVCVAVHVAETPKEQQAAGAPPFRLEVWLTRRAAKMRSHAGEVALPGGRVDAEDRDALHTALREAHEEIGLPPNMCLYLTQLSPNMSRQHLLVTPVVFLLVHNLDRSRSRRPFEPRPNPSEVASVFSTPLRMFLSEKGHGHRDMDWQDTGWKMRSHFWDFDSVIRDGYDRPESDKDDSFPPKNRRPNTEFIFGLTAGIMMQVARIALPDVEPEFVIDREGSPSEDEKIAYLQKGGRFGPSPPVLVKEEKSATAASPTSAKL